VTRNAVRQPGPGSFAYPKFSMMSGYERIPLQGAVAILGVRFGALIGLPGRPAETILISLLKTDASWTSRGGRKPC
jgi:hypothetical protein